MKALNPEFKIVLNTTSPGDGWLFGNELGDSLKVIDSSNKLAARLNANSNNKAKKNVYNDHFLGRGQASRRRDRNRPFHSQRTYSRKDRGYWKRNKSPSPQRTENNNKRHR